MDGTNGTRNFNKPQNTKKRKNSKAHENNKKTAENNHGRIQTFNKITAGDS